MVFGLFRRKDNTRNALARTRRGLGPAVRSLFDGATLNNDAIWEGLEDALISADIGVDTTLELVKQVRERVRSESIEGAEDVIEVVKEEMAVLLDPADTSIWDWYDQEELAAKPFVLLVVGVNGTGKTTSIAKLAKHYGAMGKHVVIGAGDTFRAAAASQLQVWGERLGVDIIAQQQGADPGAVAFDAYKAAIARDADVLIFDTAGRLQNKAHLMAELSKVRRVFERLEPTAPQQTILVIDATTGHNGIEQARVFRETAGVDGVFLAKLDGTAKGGIVVAIGRELGIPVVFMGTGEGLDDLALFDTDDFVDALFEEHRAG